MLLQSPLIKWTCVDGARGGGLSPGLKLDPSSKGGVCPSAKFGFGGMIWLADHWLMNGLLITNTMMEIQLLFTVWQFEQTS